MIAALGFRFGLQLDLAVLHLDGIFHSLAAVFFLELSCFLLHEFFEGIQGGCILIAVLLLGGDQSVVKRFHVFAFGLGVGKRNPERLVFFRTQARTRGRTGGEPEAELLAAELAFLWLKDLLGFMLLVGAHALDAQNGVLGAAVAFLFDD